MTTGMNDRALGRLALGVIATLASGAWWFSRWLRDGRHAVGGDYCEPGAPLTSPAE